MHLCMCFLPSGPQIRTILICSHFLARRYFSNPFSHKRSIRIGKLPQQHDFVKASFVILVCCHFGSPYHVDGSVNNVLCLGGHFWKIAGLHAHGISSWARLESKEALSIVISKPVALLGLERSAGKTVSISTFFHPLSRSASGFASKPCLPLEISWIFGPWSFRLAFETVPSDLLFNLNLRQNSIRVEPSDFPEMTASTQNVICWTIHMVGCHKVTINQNNKWCIVPMHLYTPLGWTRIGKTSSG